MLLYGFRFATDGVGVGGGGNAGGGARAEVGRKQESLGGEGRSPGRCCGNENVLALG